jgi:hypothetical protein
MPDNIRSTVRLFADDTSMYLTITSHSTSARRPGQISKLGAGIDDEFLPRKE